MADLQSIIKIIFSGQDDLSESARGAAKSISDFGTIATTVAKPLADFANAALLTEGAVIAMAGALVAKGIDSAGKFNDSFAFTTTLIDDTGQSVDNFREDILNYAQSSTQSIESINNAIQSAVGQGIKYSDSIELLAIAEKLAVAQGGELNETTQLLVGTLNGYGLKVTDAAKLSDQFSITIRDGKISISELSVGLSQITPLAATLGVGFDQVGAALATLTSQGVPGAQAMTLVKGVLSGIISPTDQAKEAALALGVNFTAAGLASKGLGGFLAEVIQKAGGSAEKISQLFTDTEPLIGALALGGIGAESFAKELKAMATETDVTNVAFKKMADNIGLSVQRIRNSIDIAFIRFGDPLLDEIGALSKGVAGIFNALGDSFKDGGALRPISAALEDFISSLSETLATIGKNLPDALEGLNFSRLLESFSGLGEAVKELFDVFSGGLDLTTTEGLSDAIQKIVDSGALLTEIVTGIVEAFRPLADAAGRAVEEFQKLDSASAIDFGNIIGSAKLLTDAGIGLGLALVAIGKSSLEMGDAFNIGFGVAGAAANALQITFDAVVKKYLEIKKASLESKIADEDTPWGSPEKVRIYNEQLAEVKLKLEAVTNNLDNNGAEFDKWKNLIQEGASGTSKLKTELESTESSLKKFRESTKESSGNITEWGLDVAEAADSVDESIRKVSDREFKLDAPDADAFGNFSNTLDALDGNLSGLALSAEKAGFGTDKFSSSAKDVTKALTPLSFAAAESAGMVERTGVRFDELVPKIISLRNANGNVIDSWTELGTASEDTGFKLQNVTKSVDGIVTSYNQAGAGAVKASDKFNTLGGTVSVVKTAFSEAKEKTDAHAKSVDELTKKSQEFQLKMEEINSNERIKTIEAVIQLNVAQLETDMERVKAAFASIDNTVSSTGDLLGGLFGQLGDADFHARSLIENQIAIENKRREDALELQKKLANAEIERIEAQRDALNRGVSMIEIDGKGLQPHLEAFMFEVLKAIRVELTGTYSDFLLALAAPA